jgi:hypothetical protein
MKKRTVNENTLLYIIIELYKFYGKCALESIHNTICCVKNFSKNKQLLTV